MSGPSNHRGKRSPALNRCPGTIFLIVFIMKTETPRDLLWDHLQDLFSVESQLKTSLPVVARRAVNDRLAAFLTGHLNETEKHLDTVSHIHSFHGYELGADLIRQAGLRCISIAVP